MPISKTRLGLATLLTGATLSGCGSTVNDSQLASGPAAYSTIEPKSIPAPTVYQIAPADVLALTVFDEPQVSNPSLRVDEMGYVQIPLIGQVRAAGLSAPELSDAIALRLKRSYLVNPRVNISVSEPAKRFVSVEGEVNQPGVYEISRSFTLLAALARAQSPTTSAKLDQVIILRTINGQRMAARFNIKDIRGGISPDPQVMDNDVIVVGYSRSRGFYQDMLRAAPLFNAFVVFGRAI